MKKSISVILAVIGFALVMILGVKSTAFGENSKKSVEVVFTHDIHSYLDSYTDCIDGENQTVGGMARLSTFIKELKKDGSEPLIVDGGDLAMGTLYQALYTKDAPELRLLGRLGFDATTFGNHDFDYSDDKLAQMFASAASSGDRLPSLCISNIDWDYDNESTRMIYEEASKCNLCEYAVVEKNGVRIAIFGIFGKRATEDSPTLKLKVDDQIESAKAVVAKINEDEDVDMIVCLSHSGTTSDSETSEDELLAASVPEIDIILSAHSHTRLTQPIICGNTYIVSCGCYGRDTGLINLTQNAEGRWALDSYELVAMTEKFSEDEEIKEILSEYKGEVDEYYLSQYEMNTDQVLAYSPYTFETVSDMYNVKEEHILGNFMSDAYRFAARMSGNEADVAVVPAGTVRGTVYEGKVTVKDAFMCYSLGMGYDDQVGFPLVCFYLTGKELKLISEVDASLSDIMNEARLYVSGVSYTIGTKRMFLNRALDIYYNPEVMSDTREAVDDDRMYAVVTDLYTARMLGSVSRISKGLITIEPKYKDGKLLESDSEDYIWENAVLHNRDGSELKAWVGIASYLQSFDKNEEGLSVIPEYYGEFHNRKVIDERFSIRNTNRYFWIIITIVALVLALITIVLMLLIKMIRVIALRYRKLKGLTKN